MIAQKSRKKSKKINKIEADGIEKVKMKKKSKDFCTF